MCVHEIQAKGVYNLLVNLIIIIVSLYLRAWFWDSDDLENGMTHKLSMKVADITGLDTEHRNKCSSAEPFQVKNKFFSL